MPRLFFSGAGTGSTGIPMTTEPMPGFPSERDKRQWEKWKHVIYAAETLSGIERSPTSIEQIIKCLDEIEEVFPKTVDPVEDFEGYALRQFTKAIKSALTRTI